MTEENKELDTPELQELFDNAIKNNEQDIPINLSIEPSGDVFNDLGQLTRQLHQSLRELGLDKELNSAVSTIPDAHDRLKYIADLTENSAQRVLNAIDKIEPIQGVLANEAQSLYDKWNTAFLGKMDAEQFRNLANETRNYLMSVSPRNNQIHSDLMEIMMAQDFQDLTGQVIKKLTLLISDLEKKLLSILVEHAPGEKIVLEGEHGPAYNAETKDASVSNQEEVDNLLESLGF